MGDLVFLKTNDSNDFDTYVQQELQELKDANPLFGDFLDEGGFRLYFYKRSNKVMVTDDRDVDIPLELFTAICRSHLRKGGHNM